MISNVRERLLQPLRFMTVAYITPFAKGQTLSDFLTEKISCCRISSKNIGRKGKNLPVALD